LQLVAEYQKHFGDVVFPARIGSSGSCASYFLVPVSCHVLDLAPWLQAPWFPAQWFPATLQRPSCLPAG
jgi:hypothetical protein